MSDDELSKEKNEMPDILDAEDLNLDKLFKEKNETLDVLDAEDLNEENTQDKQTWKKGEISDKAKELPRGSLLNKSKKSASSEAKPEPEPESESRDLEQPTVVLGNKFIYLYHEHIDKVKSFLNNNDSQLAQAEELRLEAKELEEKAKEYENLIANGEISADDQAFYKAQMKEIDEKNITSLHEQLNKKAEELKSPADNLAVNINESANKNMLHQFYEANQNRLNKLKNKSDMSKKRQKDHKFENFVNDFNNKCLKHQHATFEGWGISNLSNSEKKEEKAMLLDNNAEDGNTDRVSVENSKKTGMLNLQCQQTPPSDKDIMMMVEFAKNVSRKTNKKEVQITGGTKCPEQAVKLYMAYTAAGLKPKMAPQVRAAAEEAGFKEHLEKIDKIKEGNFSVAKLQKAVGEVNNDKPLKAKI